MSDQQSDSAYRQLVAKNRPESPPTKSAEADLDGLISSLYSRADSQTPASAPPRRDPVEAFREQLITDYVPTFVELVEKYAKAGISMQMDASSFLEGGREIKFEFGVGDHRLQMRGTVTAEGIAFQEIRYTPEFHGELTSGPMLRLRNLNPRTFREFICDKLTGLMRSVMRRKLG